MVKKVDVKDIIIFNCDNPDCAIISISQKRDEILEKNGRNCPLCLRPMRCLNLRGFLNLRK